MRSNNPFFDRRGRNGPSAAQERVNGGGGGGNRGEKDNRPNTISGRERDFWETRNWETYWNSELSQFGGQDTDFADWYKNVYGKQLYDQYQNEVNSQGHKIGKDKWGQYVRDTLSDRDAVMTAFNRYYANNNKSAALMASFGQNGLGAANNTSSQFGQWLNNKMGTELQNEYAQRNNSQQDFYDFLNEKVSSGAYNDYYNEYMQDPSRMAPSFGGARWQAF